MDWRFNSWADTEPKKKSHEVPLLARESQKLERWLFLSPKVSAEWMGVTKNMKMKRKDEARFWRPEKQGLALQGQKWTSHIKRRKWIHSSPASCSVQACSGLGAVLTSLGWWEQTFYNTSVDAAVNLCDTTLTDMPWNRILPPPTWASFSWYPKFNHHC